MASEVPFRELVQYAIGGGWGHEERTTGTVPVRVIRGTDFGNIASGAFDQVPLRFEARKKGERRLLQPNDIVLEISGGSRTSNQSTGRSLFITQDTLDQLGQSAIPASFCRLVRLCDDIVAPRYAYYALQEMYRSGRAGLYEHHSTGISNFQFEYFLDQEFVRLPTLPEQRAIAHILGTLDDKIELNRRMSETLEAMARALFKSWFVDFDPVRAKAEGRDPGLPKPLADLFPARLVESELGEIPEGWEVATLGALAQIQGGKQLPTEDCKSVGAFPVFGANGIMGYADHATHDGFVIAFGRVGAYCGSVHWTYGGAWINNNASSVLPKHSPEFVLQAMLTADFEGMRTGSAQPFIPNSSLASLPLVRPPDVVLAQFCAAARSFRLKEQVCRKDSDNLSTLRDTLLPKLISGELRVEDAERFIGKAT